MNMSPMKTKIALIAAALCALSLHAKKVEETTTHIIPQENITSLEVSNVNGSINCIGWDKSEIDITYTKRVKASSQEDAKEYLDKILVEVTKGDGKIVIKTKYPQKKNLAFWNWFENKSGSVSYDIHVPASLTIVANTVNGSVGIEGIAGKVYSNSVNGRLEAKELGSPAKMSTVNGSIVCRFAEDCTVQEMEFSSVNGSIKTYVPESIGCSLSVKTVNGSIKTDLAISNLETQKRNRLKCDINGGGPLLRFSTVNGSVRISKSS